MLYLLLEIIEIIRSLKITWGNDKTRIDKFKVSEFIRRGAK